MDRNSYYGAESASLNLAQLYEKIRGSGEKAPDALGSSRDYNIDLIPKFLMANGKLVNLLRRTGVTRYLEFLLVDGGYVYREGKIYKVPVTGPEALRSSLLGLLEKNKCRKFFMYVQEYEENDPKTWDGCDLNKMTMQGLFDKFSLNESLAEFVGHAVALHLDDEYLTQPAIDTVRKMKLYEESLSMYGKSPYVYPLYGLGELPQGFARLSAIYGGTYMLNKPAEEIVYNEDGTVAGVKSEGEVARCKMVIADPSYFPDKVRKVRPSHSLHLAILSHPIKNTDDAKSCQIIIPRKQVKRNNDVYVCCTSFTHKVAPTGKYIALVSTKVETSNPIAEIKAGLDLLEPIDERFVNIVDTYEPISDGKTDNVFLSSSYDATSHFETTADDILSLYERITGSPFDWSKQPEVAAEDEAQ
eukprot:TRINITY_DN586_c0_g1_i1.p1 TRINITY_DN586_c0_g1~~TRINITY_DN586_c0_g1_i1.p1  ORF type:complete len:415 (+),score=185.05 TRINITY_DN586_c0_g1_i1:155-1399(+)